MAVLSVRAGIRAAGVMVAGLLTSGAALAGPVQFKPGDILAAAPNADAVVRVDPNTGATSVLLSDPLLDLAGRVSLAPDGKSLYVTSMGGRLIHVDVATGSMTHIATDLQVWAFDIRADGSLVVAGDASAEPGPPALYRLDADGHNRRTIAAALSSDVVDLVIEAGGTSALYTDRYTSDAIPSEGGPGEMGGDVFRVDLLTGALTPVSNDGHLITPNAITVAPDGRILVGDQGFENTEADGRVIAVDPLTGQQTVISGGNLLGGVFALDFDAGGRLIVANPAQHILGIDLATGAQTVLATGYFFTDVEVVPGANPIPLPAAAWAGLLVMGGIAARRGVGRLARR